MMKIVGTVLCAVLGILLALVLLFCALLTPRVGVHLRAQDGRVVLILFYGRLQRVIRLPLQKKAQTDKPAGTPQPAAAQPDGAGLDLSGLDLGQAVSDGLGLLGQLKDQLRIDRLHLDVTIATGDAAQTGLLLGAASALGGMVYPFLVQTFHVEDFHAAVDGDFEGTHTRWTLELCCAVRPIALVWVGLRNARMLLGYYRSITKKTEAHTI